MARCSPCLESTSRAARAGTTLGPCMCSALVHGVTVLSGFQVLLAGVCCLPPRPSLSYTAPSSPASAPIAFRHCEPAAISRPELRCEDSGGRIDLAKSRRMALDLEPARDIGSRFAIHASAAAPGPSLQGRYLGIQGTGPRQSPGSAVACPRKLV